MRFVHAFLCGMAAVTVWGQLSPEVALLAKLRRRVGAAIQQSVDYTCLETIQRFESSGRTRFRLRKLDTIRLEVAQIGQREVVAFPGSREFDKRDRSSMVGIGMSVSGVFHAFGGAVFVDRSATVRFEAWENVAGRKLARFSYSIPQYASGYRISSFGGRSTTVGSSGQFWADPVREELVRLTAIADDVPIELGMRSVLVDIRYGRVSLTSGEVQLPETSIAVSSDWVGRESRNYSEFTQCRSFRAESSLKFEETDTAAAEPAKTVDTELIADETLPAGVDIPIVLDSGFAFGESLAGDPLNAHVADDIRVKGKVLIPKGATVLGRLRRFERYDDPFDFVLAGVEFSEVVFPGKRLRFTGRMKNIRLPPSVGTLARPAGVKVRQRDGAIPETTSVWEFSPFELPGVATIYLTAVPFKIAPGLELWWRTQELE